MFFNSVYTEKGNPKGSLCMQSFHFNIRQNGVQKSQLESLCMSPSGGSSNTVQAIADT